MSCCHLLSRSSFGSYSAGFGFENVFGELLDLVLIRETCHHESVSQRTKTCNTCLLQDQMTTTDRTEQTNRVPNFYFLCSFCNIPFFYLFKQKDVIFFLLMSKRVQIKQWQKLTWFSSQQRLKGCERYRLLYHPFLILEAYFFLLIPQSFSNISFTSVFPHSLNGLVHYLSETMVDRSVTY